MKTVEQRFWEKVDKNGPGGCWLWTGTPSKRYGQFRPTPVRMVAAHRFSYELNVGPIPDGLEIDHLCWEKRCVNPDHLEPVTRQVNQSRAPNPFGARTHCPRGHQYDTQNTYIQIKRDGSQARACRKCKALSQREYVARKQTA